MERMTDPYQPSHMHFEMSEECDPSATAAAPGRRGQCASWALPRAPARRASRMRADALASAADPALATAQPSMPSTRTSGIVGMGDSVDEAIGLPTDFSASLARNTQLILAHDGSGGERPRGALGGDGRALVVGDGHVGEAGGGALAAGRREGRHAVEDGHEGAGHLVGVPRALTLALDRRGGGWHCDGRHGRTSRRGRALAVQAALRQDAALWARAR